MLIDYAGVCKNLGGEGSKPLVAAYSSGRCNFGGCSVRVSDPELCSCTPISYRDLKFA